MTNLSKNARMRTKVKTVFVFRNIAIKKTFLVRFLNNLLRNLIRHCIHPLITATSHTVFITPVRNTLMQSPAFIFQESD